MLRTARTLALLLPLVTALGASRPSHASPAVASATGGALLDVPTAGASRATSEAALARLASSSPQLHALWRPGQVGPALVTGLREPTPTGSVEARARAFLDAHAAVIGARSVTLGTATVRSAAGRTVVSLPQLHGALEVWGRQVSVTLDETGAVLTLTNDLADVGVVAPPTVSLEAARLTAARAVGAPRASDGRRVLVVGPAGSFEAGLFFAAPEGTLEAREVLVNLSDGAVASVRQAVQH